MAKWIDRLRERYADPEFVAWCESLGDVDQQTAWDKCSNSRWMVWVLLRVKQAGSPDYIKKLTELLCTTIEAAAERNTGAAKLFMTEAVSIMREHGGVSGDSEELTDLVKRSRDFSKSLAEQSEIDGYHGVYYAALFVSDDRRWPRGANADTAFISLLLAMAQQEVENPSPVRFWMDLNIAESEVSERLATLIRSHYPIVPELLEITDLLGCDRC